MMIIWVVYVVFCHLSHFYNSSLLLMIGPKQIVANNFEVMQYMVGCYVQLSVKTNPTKVSEIVNEISKKAIGCRTKFDGKIYEYTDKPCPVFQIPDNFPHLENAHIYASKHHTIPASERLASICYNKDTVIYNCNHTSADGGYLKMLLDHLCGRPTPNDPFYRIHESVVDALADQFDKVDRPISTHTTPVRNYKTPQDNVMAQFNLIEFPLEEKISNFTDKLLAATILTTSADNGFLGTMACHTAVDARRLLKNSDWRHVNIDGLVVSDAGTDIHTDFSKMTVGELQKRFKKDLINKINNGELLNVIKHVRDNTYVFPTYATVSMSNVGVIRTGGDIKDAMTTFSVTGGPYPPGNLQLSATTVDGKLFRGRLFTSPYVTSRSEAKSFARAIEYCIRYVHEEMSVKDAFMKLINIMK